MSQTLNEFDIIYQDIFKDDSNYQYELHTLFNNIINNILYLEKNNLPLSNNDIYFSSIISFFKKNQCNYNNIDIFLRNYDIVLEKNLGLKYNSKQIYEIIGYQHKIIDSSIMHLYFKEIYDYFEEGYTIFGLGDSLYKFDSFWNIVNPDKEIINIPFSGKFYDNKDGKPLFNKDIYDKMIADIDILYLNNPNFKKMIDLIGYDKRVLITDFGNYGSSTTTILTLLSHIPRIASKIKNIKLLLLTFNDDISNIIKEQLHSLNNCIDISGILKVQLSDDVISHYYTNSEESSSRCVPKYDNKLWNNAPNKMYMDGLNYNYVGCYLSKYIHFIYNYCYYYTIILPSLSQKYNNIYKEVNENAKNFFNVNYMSEIAYFYDKILKYFNKLYEYEKLKKITKNYITTTVYNIHIKNILIVVQHFKQVSIEEYNKIFIYISEQINNINKILIKKNDQVVIEEIERKYYKYKSKYLELKKLLENQRF